MKIGGSVVLGALIAAACSGSSRAPAVPEPPDGERASPNALAPLDAPLVAASSTAHVFTPKPHGPRKRPGAVSIDPKSLPSLRRTSCFAEALAAPVTGGPPSLRGMGASGAGAPVTSVPKAAAPQKGRAAGGRRTQNQPLPGAPAEGYAYSADAAAQAAPPPPAAEPAPSPAARRAPEEKGARERSVIAKEERGDAARGGYHDFGASIYLSNDDTMSLSSAQRVLFAIDRFLPIPPEQVRPHELLNYFSFETSQVRPTDDFGVQAEIEEKPGEPGAYTLALSVSGREISKEERRNAALTFVIDRSGSMESEGRMEYLKRGLLRMTSELKRGDLVQLVLFDDEVCVPLENFAVGRDSMDVLTSTIQKIRPRNSTDVDAGLRRGYALADASYQSTHSNRVVLITDALANTGETDPEVISLISRHYDTRRIRLSGVGVGTEFNDGLLDSLTEKGKGAYVFLGSGAEVDAVFGTRFVSLIETVANDVHFRLHLPPSLGMKVFYGEESSTAKQDVQAIHYFAGTNQLFLSDLAARGGTLRKEDSVMLSIEYSDPETGAAQVEEYAFTLRNILGNGKMVEKGRFLMSFIDGLADTIRSSPERVAHRAGGWIDGYAAEQCDRGRASLAEQARSLENDPEVARVVKLWDTYCSRYEAARSPVRRRPPTGTDVWPSAQR